MLVIFSFLSLFEVSTFTAFLAMDYNVSQKSFFEHCDKYLVEARSPAGNWGNKIQQDYMASATAAAGLVSSSTAPFWLAGGAPQAPAQGGCLVGCST